MNNEVLCSHVKTFGRLFHIAALPATERKRPGSTGLRVREGLVVMKRNRDQVGWLRWDSRYSYSFRWQMLPLHECKRKERERKTQYFGTTKQLHFMILYAWVYILAVECQVAFFLHPGWPNPLMTDAEKLHLFTI